MEIFKIGQRVYLPTDEGAAYQSGDITGEVRGMGSIVREDGELSVQYIILLDEGFRGYVDNSEARDNYITHMVAAVDGVEPLEDVDPCEEHIHISDPDCEACERELGR